MKLNTQKYKDYRTKFIVSKSQDGIKYTKDEVKRIIKRLQHGKSLFHQFDRKKNIRVRVIDLGDFIYVTVAIDNSMTIQQVDRDNLHDAIAIAKAYIGITESIHLVPKAMPTKEELIEDAKN